MPAILPMISECYNEFSLLEEQGAFLIVQGGKAGITNGGRVRRGPTSHSPAAQWRRAPADHGHIETTAAEAVKTAVSSPMRTIVSKKVSKKVASQCVQAFTGVHASGATFHFSLSAKLENGRGRPLHARFDREPHCPKAIPQGRGRAQLLSISDGANASHAGSASPDERRSRADLPRAISCNCGQLQLLLAGGHSGYRRPLGSARAPATPKIFPLTPQAAFSI